MLRRILPVAAVAALAFPAGAAARSFHGTVVERHGHTFVVADCSAAPGQTMARVRSAHRAPRAGVRVTVTASRRHGRWVARSIHRHGRRHGGCEIEGTITDPHGPDGPGHDQGDDHGDDGPDHDQGDDHGGDDDGGRSGHGGGGDDD